MEATEHFDGESVKVIRTEPMTIERTVADITDQTQRGLQLFEERVAVAKKQLAIALRLTQPGQFVVMDGGDGKETVYATAGAADRILRMGFGMRWGEKTVRVDRTAEDMTAIATANLLKHDGTIYEKFEGRRRAVFDAEAPGGVKGFLKNEHDLIKGALANLAHQAVTQILGLRFLTPADFAELGLDLKKLPRRADFHDRGGDDDSVPRVAFGKNKGKAITDLSDNSLKWYIEAAQTTIADPAKAKYKAKEERWLGHLEAERDRRAGKAAPKTETPKGAKGAAKSEKEQLAAEMGANPETGEVPDDGMPPWPSDDDAPQGRGR